tara:strand:+ start:294 stop:1490 length:1197 start_codon:yes stop_codon:yes gene_type:complete
MIRNLKTNILVLFFTITILFLIYPKILYEYLVFQMPFSDQAPQSYFADWTVIISAIKCKLLGNDVFLSNPCDYWNRAHVYGSIFLFLPFHENLNNFYNLYLPVFVNLIFLFVIISHINFKKFGQILFYVLFVFSPATLLAMERFNNDILIFLVLIYVCYLKSKSIKFILISLISLAKFYPLITSVTFFFGGINKKNLLFFAIFVSMILFIFFLDRNNLEKVFLNASQYTPSYKLAFGIQHFANFPSLNIKFFFVHLLMFSLFLMTVLFLLSFLILRNDNFLSRFSFENYNERMFFIGAIVCVATYLLQNNFIYREIFIFFILPFVFKATNQSLFAKLMLSTLILKFLLFPATFYYSMSFNNETLNIIKSIIDNLVISMLLASLTVILLKTLKSRQIQI